ncbi:MAG: DNA cytosine methyltransferase, partial [Pseudomonadota bacterium]
MPEKYKLIDLFSGAGGMTLGFVNPTLNGSYRSVFAIDNDKSAVDTYNLNFSNGTHKATCANIEDWLRSDDIPASDVVIGGPPCQGFSLLNKQRQGDARRALWEPFMDVVEKSGSSIFVMENVPGLLKSSEFAEISIRARALGFEMLTPAVLNMADY